MSGSLADRSSPVIGQAVRSQSSLSLRGHGEDQTSPSLIRSIFPRYNHALPLEQQAYFPTQNSPTNIPPQGFSRPEYSPNVNGGSGSVGALASPSPVKGASPTSSCSQHRMCGAATMEASSDEDLKQLWKVTNGWKVSRSEGRRFCLKMECSPEEPIYTLSSATQAFYTLRLDPTSISAQVTLTRQEPGKTPSKSFVATPTGSSRSDTGLEAIGTTLEERARRLPPNDGLIALLLPILATRMVNNMSSTRNSGGDGSFLAAAEKECGKLMWDHDAQKYVLLHPSMQTPFTVAITSSPAWSRTEVTLEHQLLPRNLVRLVQDGTGAGFLEIDTGSAAKVDCFYIVDVAVCALMLVAIEELKGKSAGTFSAPPVDTLGKDMDQKNEDKTKDEKAKAAKIVELDMDVESQITLNKSAGRKSDKLPGFCGLLWMMMRCFFWTACKIVKGVVACPIAMYRCCRKRKQ